MENKGLLRLQAGVEKLLESQAAADERERQLSAALARGGADLEKLKSENFRLSKQRGEARKRLDSLIGRVDKLATNGESQ